MPQSGSTSLIFCCVTGTACLPGFILLAAIANAICAGRAETIASATLCSLPRRGKFERRVDCRSCPLCGSSATGECLPSPHGSGPLEPICVRVAQIAEYMHPRLLECGACGLLYGDPVLSPTTLAAAYREAAFDSAGEAVYASGAYAERFAAYPQSAGPGRGARHRNGRRAFFERLLELGFANVAELSRPRLRSRLRSRRSSR